MRWYLVAMFTVPVGATSLVIYGPTSAGLTSRWLAASAGGGGRRLCASAGDVSAGRRGRFTRFLQHHWQDRYQPMKLALYVALLWAVWHMPDHFAGEGWGAGR